MRKFFKSLAVLLALTLIVGVIPAAAADSLSMQKEKILYLGGSQGTKEDGTKCKTGAKKLVANMIKGFDKDTMSVDLKSADNSIVKASNKTGKITAKSLGTTTVTVTVYDAAETQILKQDLKVKVKKNAADVTVTGIADGDKFSVGQEVPVTLPRQGVDTDERELTVDKTDIVELKAGEKNRTYTVKFLKAGEATFTAKAYQSAKYPVATQTKTIKVTVGNPVPSSAKVIASDAIELTFDEDVEALGLFKDAKDIPYNAIYYMANSSTPVYINAVKAVKATGNKVKVDLFSPLLNGVPYFVEINGSKLEIALTKSGAKDVASVVITTTVATKDVAKSIDYVLYNDEGVDITTSALAAGGRVTITQAEYNAEITETASNKYQILMWNKDAKASLTIKYSYLDSNDNYKEYPASGDGVITCVEESPYVFKKTVWTLNDGTAISSSATNLKKYFSIGEDSYYLTGVVVFNQNGQDKEYAIGTTTVATENELLKVWFPDNNFAMFNASNNIVGNKAGTATAFVGYTKNGADKILDVISIEVREARKQSRVELAIKNDKKTLNGTDVVAEKLTFEAKLYDQFNDLIDMEASKDIVLNQIEASADKCAFSGATSFATYGVRKETGKYELTVDGSDFAGVTKSQNVGFFVKYNNAIASNNVYFSVDDKAADTGSIAFTTDIKALDTSVFDYLSKKTEDKVATLQVAKANGGFFTGEVDLTSNFTLTKTNSHTATAAAASLQLEVVKNGSKIDITSADYNQFIKTDDADEGKIYVKNLVVDGGVVKKIPTGSYSFRLFEYDANGRVKNPQIIDIVVSDNQVKPVYKQEAQKTNVNTNYGADCFSYTFDGKAIHKLDGTETRTLVYAYNQNSNSVYVKKATVTLKVDFKNDNVDTLYNYDVEVAIGTSLNK